MCRPRTTDPVNDVMLNNPTVNHAMPNKSMPKHPTLNRPMPKRTPLGYLLPLALMLAATAALADSASEPDLERARELAQQARALRAEAETTYSTTERTCYEKFRVNRCLEDARQARLEHIREARAMEIESRRLELAVKQRQAAEAGLHAPARDAVRVEPQPAETVPSPDNAAAEAIRAQREADAAAAEVRAQADRARRDAERAESRAKAEAAAARRAEKAERDRERYDERIRRRQAED